jgi:hypothetical protein
MPFDKDRLNNLLKALLGSDELVAKWWDSPNKAFREFTPQEMFDEAPSIVINYILNQFHH